MSHPRLPLLVSSLVLLPTALVVGVAGPVAAAPPSTFGTHVSSCAQMETGFSGQHNPSHHQGRSVVHDMRDMHC